MKTRKAARVAAWSLAGLLGLALVLAIVLGAMPWDWIRGPAGSRLGDLLGRTVAIDGSIDVHLGRVIRLGAERIRIDNTTWGSRPRMVEIGRLDLSLDLPSLLRGLVVIPELKLVHPVVVLEKNAEGENNWTFGNPEAAAAKSATVPENRGEVPVVEHLVVEGGRIAYKDPTAGIDIDSRVDTAFGGDPSHERLKLAGTGTFQNAPFRLAVEGGSLLALREGSRPYPLKMDARVGETRASVQGTLTDPVTLAGINLDMRLAGKDLAEIFPIFGLAMPHTAAYSVEGRLTRAGNVWTFHDFKGRIGDSDVAGSLSADLGHAPSRLRGSLVSDKLDIRDLAGFVGAEPSPDRPPAKEGRILPDEPVDLAKLRSTDVDLRFKGRKIEVPGLPMQDFDATLSIKGGVARLAPVSFGIARGRIAGRAVLDGRGSVPAVDIDLGIEQVRFRDFFDGTPFRDQVSGLFGGRVQLAGRGRSTAEILGTGDGKIALFMAGGSFSALAVQLIGIDVAKSLGLIATEDRPVQVRCLVADFALKKGVATADTLVFDTTASAILGEGSLDFSKETIDLRVSAHPKQPTLATARSDILARGTFAKPEASVDPAGVLARGTAAAVLGTLLTPLGALIPFLDAGLGKDSPCGAMIAEAKSGEQDARKP